MAIRFKVKVLDPSGARRGVLQTSHGTVETPVFMPVGTAGFVHSLPPRDVKESGAQIILANTYHLSTQEKLGTVRRSGGLHNFMGWQGPILTDSGGFQVFSLPHRQLSDEGVTFRYEDRGSPVTLTPERSIEIQRILGADIVMAFDQCLEYPASLEATREAVRRTTLWARRCKQVPLGPEQSLFGIVQGGTYENLRRQSAMEICELDFDGYAIGGVSVGEGLEEMKRIVGYTAPLLPENKPRYVMGVGLPEDILAVVERGVDMFDCVIPTRYARSGTLFTRTGKIRIKDKAYRKDSYPVDTKCRCYTCQTYSRMVLRYLYFTGDPLAYVLGTIHNLTFYADLTADIRRAIEKRNFSNFAREWLARYQKWGSVGTSAKKG